MFTVTLDHSGGRVQEFSRHATAEQAREAACRLRVQYPRVPSVSARMPNGQILLSRKRLS